MRFLRVVPEAFGPLAGGELQLAAGMTVVWGPNESGKSTWHAALYAALCGMRRGRGAPRKAEQEFAARHRPWDTDEWLVSATAELADGSTLEFRQDLESQVDCSVRDAVLGADRSDQLMNEGSPDGAVLFGLTRRTLPPTVCVRQADMLGVLNDPKLLQEFLQRAAATGGADETAEAALARLKEFRSDNVGLDRRNSTKPLRKAIVTVEHAQQRLEQAQKEHTDYLALARQRDEAQRRADEADEQLRRARAEISRRRLAKAERRFDEVSKLADEFADGPPPEAAENDELAEQVVEALAAWRSAPEEPAPLTGPSSADLKRELSELPEPPEGDTEVDDEVAQALEEHKRAHHSLSLRENEDALDPRSHEAQGTEPPEGVTAGELRATADTLETPIPDIEPLEEEVATKSGPARRRTGLLAGAGAAGLVGLGLLAAGSTVVGLVLLLAAVGAGVGAFILSGAGDGPDPHAQARLAFQQQAVEHATQRRDAAQRQAESWGVPADPDSLRRLARGVEDRAYAAEQQGRRRHQLDELRAEAEQAEARLRATLIDHGAAVEDDLEAAFSSYQADCRSRANQAAQAARAEGLRAQRASRRQLEERAADQRHRREAAADAVRDAARATRVAGEAAEETEVDTLVEELRHWQRERAAARKAAEEQRDRWERLQMLLDGETVEQVKEELQRRRDEHAGFADVEPLDLPDDDGEAEAELTQLEESAQDAGRKLAGLDGQLDHHAENMPSVAEAEEELAEAEAELERVRKLESTLDTTTDFLKDARDRVHRDIAPRLKRSIERWLPVVTGGRYEAAAVDPADLEVQVRTASGAWREAVRLSHGTAEQIYLLLRVAMAEHLVTTGEPIPLLLDDPTVQADRQRTEAIFGILHELSAERQVIVFSQEEEAYAWAEANLTGPDDALIELDPDTIPA